MKLLINKDNKSRFTMQFTLVQDDFKFDDKVYMQYGKNAVKCKFKNVIFEDGKFEYEPYIRDGVVCQVGQNDRKFVFEIDKDKIINRFSFDSSIDIENDCLIVKAIFAFEEGQNAQQNLKKKFETNLRCEVMDKVEKQIQQLMRIKSRLDFE